MPTHFRQALLALCILSVMQASFANETEHLQELESIDIQVTKEKTEKEVVDAQQIKKEMISNAHDLVRYNTEVDVAEVGRYGNKGFAIRGVDGNRVAMNLDGMPLPEVEANEVFSPYGYQYEGRFNPDVELMGGVRVTAGADSLLSGSGAVGGAISYRSKESKDILQDKENFAGYAKVGYSNKNEEMLSAVGFAGKVGKTELMLNYAHREGHELKNHDMRKHNKDRMDVNYDFRANGEQPVSSPFSLLYPDAVKYKRDGVLAKLYYHFNDDHRIGLQGLYQKQDTHTNAHSKSTAFGDRVAYDTEELKSYGLNYRYAPLESAWLNEFNAEYQYLDVKGIAETHVWSGYTTKRHSTTHHRPTQTINHQLKLSTDFQPLNLGNLGTHQFKLSTTYSKQDYTTSKPEAHLKADGTVDYAHQGTDYVFPDAKKDIYSITLSDDITLTDRFSAKLGIRYDNYKYSPYFQNDTWFGKIETNEQEVIKRALRYSQLKFYQDYRNGFYNQKVKFDNFTYSGAFNYDILPDTLTARYKVGTGFLAPTVTQIYSAFQGQGIQQLANTNLKPEKSINHELELEYKATPNTTLTVSGYLTKYKDFIHTRYWDAPSGNIIDPNGCRLGLCAMSMNLDEAEIKGFKIGVESDLSTLLNTSGRLSTFANFHTAKDKAKVQTDNNGTLIVNTLAAVPPNLTLGLDYTSADNSWSLHGRARALVRKKEQETKGLSTEEIRSVTTVTCGDIEYYYGMCRGLNNARQDPNLGRPSTGNWVYDREAVTGYKDVVDTYRHAHRGNSVVLFDLFGSKAFGKNQNLVLNAGVYNITNVKYIPWETLRQFSNLNANQLVDTSRGGAGHGFNRYTAPGRNYAISLEYKF